MHYFAAIISAHCWYLAKAKGYSQSVVVMLAVPSVIAALFFGLLGLAPAVLMWLVLLILKQKPDAPGKAYFKITFTCPECSEEVTFKRDREGFAELCPQCGELITVPTEDGKPGVVGGESPRGLSLSRLCPEDPTCRRTPYVVHLHQIMEVIL